MDFPPARQLFYQAIHHLDEAASLERAALYIAQEEYPDLQVELYLQTLDSFALEVQKRLPTQPYPLKLIQTLNQYLYHDLQFTGNTAEYYDPRNSFLNDVLDRRTGIPITLSLVYLAIARRLNFPMAGVGMPGHFLIRPTLEGMELFVDAFHQGELLFLQDCQERLALQGYSESALAAVLAPMPPQKFLVRMLTNLKMIYLNQGDMLRGLAAIDRILLIFPNASLELRDRGILHYRLNRLTLARQDLETYLTLEPAATDTLAVKQLLQQIRQQS